MGQNIDGLVAGIDFFNPAMVKLVMYPVAGAIVVSLGETLVAPLTRVTILSQLEGDNNNNNNNNRPKKLGGLEELLRSKFGYRISYLGITSLANSFFKPLLFVVTYNLQYDPRPGPMFMMSGAFSALTASVILLPFKTTSTNKGYTATFRDIWSDGGFRSLFLKAKPIYSGYKPRVMSDLRWVVIVSFVPEILRGLGVDVDHFSHNFTKQFGGKDILVTRLCYRLCYFGIVSLANSCFKTLLFSGYIEPGQLLMGSEAWSGLTAYIVSIPLRTNKFLDRFKDDDSFWFLRISIMVAEVFGMALLVLSFKDESKPHDNGFDLALAGMLALASMVPEMLIAGVNCLLPADFEFSPEELWREDFTVNILHSLTYCGVNSFAYLSLKCLLLKTYASTWSPKSVAFTSGALASLAASLVSHPFDTLLTHYIADPNPDANLETTISNLSQKEDGLHSMLYAGLSASLFSAVPSMTISLLACEAVSLFWERPSPSSESTTFMFDLARTSIATVTASAAMYPIEVVRRRMQMERSSAKDNKRAGLFKTFKRMLRKRGIRGLYSGINSHLVKVVVGHALAFTAFELLMKLSPSPNGGRLRLYNSFRRFIITMGQQNIIADLVAGIDFFNPAMVKLVTYPVAGAIVVSLGETFVAPLTRVTILSQLEGDNNNNNNNNQQQQLGGLEEFLRSKFGYRLCYLGITCLANSCFKPLLFSVKEVLQYDSQICPSFMVCGAFSALTASIILLPFKTTRTNKGYTATFRDIWSDGGFRSLFLKAKPGVGGMTVGILQYGWGMSADHTWARATSDLTRAVIVCFVPEVLKDLGVDVDHFSHIIRKQFGRKDFLGTKFGYRLCYYGITALANSCFKPLLWTDNIHPFRQHHVFFRSGVLSALTASIILLPFRTSTNKGYTATFRDYDFVSTRMFLDVARMALCVYVIEMEEAHTGNKGCTVTVGLVYAGLIALVSITPEILQEWFLHYFENSKGLWRDDLLVNILHNLLYCGVNSFTYLSLKSFLAPSASSTFTSGALASLAASLVSYPFDTLMTHNIAAKGKDHNSDDATWKTTITNLCHKEGDLQSLLYAGFSASLFSIIPSMTISLVACEAVSLLWERPSPSSESTTFMFDLARTSIATVTASTVMYPVEVVRRRMQMEKGTKNNSKSIGLFETFKGMLRKEGVGRLYSGINSHLVKVVVGHAIAFTAFELFTKSRSPNAGSISFHSSSRDSS
ncbi:Mitochondrial thiamine pyrophosphate carrier 1 [Linum grandiflorum]